jgi:ABC-2 type transport system ATP-binding protein
MWQDPEKSAGKRTSSYTVRTEHLRKEFDGLVAVDDLNLRVKKGILYGMIGPNGSGKTTTIKMLMGLQRPTKGGCSILGECVPIRENIARVGYMPQEMAVYNDLSIHENLQLFAELYSVPKDVFAKMEKDLLAMVDLSDRRDSAVSQLSGGMKHRVSLACTLVHDPEVLFLDEPTVGVDPELRAGFWTYFGRLKERGKTIVMTTHYMDEASRCDAVGMMRAGRLIAEGTPDELMAETSTDNLEDAFLTYSKEGGK